MFSPIILDAAVTALKGNWMFPFHSAYHGDFSHLKGHYINPGLAPTPLQNVKNAGGYVESTGKNPHFQRAVCSTGEDPIALHSFNLGDSSTNISENGLLSMFIFKRMN